MEIKSFSGKSITSIEEWLEHSPPAHKELHWKDGRSAKEMAKFWLNRDEQSAVPGELLTLLNSNPVTSDLDFEWAMSEYKTELDTFGKGRIHDLLLAAKKENHGFVISIEAKSDEPFGKTIAQRRKNNPVHSKVEQRIATLAKQLFHQVNIEELRYQLLHGIAGTLLEAKNKKQILQCLLFRSLLVHLLIPKNSKKTQPI